MCRSKDASAFLIILFLNSWGLWLITQWYFVDQHISRSPAFMQSWIVCLPGGWGFGLLKGTVSDNTCAHFLHMSYRWCEWNVAHVLVLYVFRHRNCSILQVHGNKITLYSVEVFPPMHIPVCIQGDIYVYESDYALSLDPDIIQDKEKQISSFSTPS